MHLFWVYFSGIFRGVGVYLFPIFSALGYDFSINFVSFLHILDGWGNRLIEIRNRHRQKCTSIYSFLSHKAITYKTSNSSQRRYLRYPSILHYSNKKISPTKLPIPIPPALTSLPAAPPSAAIFPTSPVGTPFPVALQLSISHPNPSGQHPPPSSSPHPNHPSAQRPVGRAVGPSPSSPSLSPVGTGTTSVFPFSLTIVVEELVGQDVEWQSRPTRQQPPW